MYRLKFCRPWRCSAGPACQCSGALESCRRCRWPTLWWKHLPSPQCLTTPTPVPFAPCTVKAVMFTSGPCRPDITGRWPLMTGSCRLASRRRDRRLVTWLRPRGVGRVKASASKPPPLVARVVHPPAPPPRVRKRRSAYQGSRRRL